MSDDPKLEAPAELHTDEHVDPAVPRRSLVDGELKTPVALNDFLHGIGPLFRLADKQRIKLKAAVIEETKGGTRLPLKFLIPGLVAAAVITGLMWFGGSAQAGIPDALIGEWSTTTKLYAGRGFRIQPDTITLFMGNGIYERHRISDVQKTAAGDSTNYQVTYLDRDRPVVFGFWYVSAPGPVIRLPHQPAVTWKKGAPITSN
ncbi:MAG: hypothetical protein ABJD11_18395 [Gemmatimonadota bacterium]